MSKSDSLLAVCRTWGFAEAITERVPALCRSPSGASIRAAEIGSAVSRHHGIADAG